MGEYYFPDEVDEVETSRRHVGKLNRDLATARLLTAVSRFRAPFDASGEEHDCENNHDMSQQQLSAKKQQGISPVTEV